MFGKGKDWSVPATREDRDQAQSVLKEQLRLGSISYDLYLARSDEVARAKYVGDIFNQVAQNSKRLRPKGMRRIIRPSTFNVLTLVVAASLMTGLWANVFLGVGVMVLCIAASLGSSLYRSYRKSRASSARVDPSSRH